MKFCSKCGAPCDDHANACPECGNMFSQNTAGPNSDSQNTNSNPNMNGNPYNTAYGNANTNGNPNMNGNPYMNNTPNMNSYRGATERSIPLCILFTIITCGIYGIYWMIVLNDEINPLAGEPQATSGGMVLLLSFVTCGIYGLYWMYKMGERCDRINGGAGNSNILFLVIGILGFGIINYCLMQDTLNKVARSRRGMY